MAGHNKWSKIKRSKGVNDTQKGELYTRLLKDITAAVQQGSPMPASNPRLRMAIQKAKEANLPKDRIMRAIKKVSDTDHTGYIRVEYEGYAPHGVAVLVEGLTDNQNRAVASVRAAFTKHGGSMAKKGSIAHLFVQKGFFCIPVKAITEEKTATLMLIESGAEKLDKGRTHFYVTCSVANFGKVQKALATQAILVQEARLQYLPHTINKLQKEAFSKVNKLIDALKALEDVQHVYHNLALEDD